MLKNQNIICISSIDWDFIWQGHQEIMTTFAKNGNRVFFIENTGVRAPNIKDIARLKRRFQNYFRGIKGIRQERPNLYIYSPIILPFPYLRLARIINRFIILSILKRWMKIMNFDDPVIWAFLPTGLTLDIVDNINNKLTIYYCIDNFAVSSAAAKKIKKTEKRLLKKTDLVFVTSRALYNYCSQYNNRVHIFPFGVSIEEFEKAKVNDIQELIELKGIQQPIVGYIGGLHKWIDLHLIKFLAESHPHCSFVFIGPLQADISLLLGVKNIYFLGNKDHRDLPYFIKNFTVCIIPYLISEYTKNVYPTKLNEYLAMGKPVISTNLPEIEEFNKKYGNIIYVANKPEDFTRYIDKAIKEDSDALRERRIGIARENSWPNRIEEMCNLIEKAINKKIIDKGLAWKESLLSLYHNARRRFMRLAVSLVLIYILLFYTPFIWFLAEPLKISQKPETVDAIVVFAGGVGESGKPGQGYEERVQYAVQLYKKGFAPHIIFSSGYRYIFEEPLVMKVLAVSMGVPADAIILEDKAKNTYENINFVKDILDKEKWNRILIVSSPYHMLRASLVIKKAAPGIKVIYTPIPQSQFYSHGITPSGRKIYKQINLQQIKALIHEYLGILYYWRKGYI